MNCTRSRNSVKTFLSAIRTNTWVSENLKELDSFLDRKTELALNGDPITFRAVLETFLYGDQAHVNRTKD
jgi:hypothetical protein